MLRIPLWFSLLSLALTILLPASPAVAANVSVTVSSNLFNPAMVNIQVGDSVTWMNQGGVHNVKADNGGFTSGAPSSAAWTFTHTFTSAGTFVYHCEVHGAAGGLGMSGVVNVTGAAGVPGSLRFANTAFNVNEASGTATIQLQRVGGDDGAVGVSFSTANGSATAGQDYTATNQTVSWPDNDDNPKFVNVPILNDTADEPNETVFLNLGNATGGATLGNPSSAILTIVDDDEVTPPPPPPTPTECVADATTLCLLNDRFQIRVDWETRQGASGQGQAVELTPDTGYFWFFNANNVEMVIKVRNACVDPFNRFWVFAGGLTNVQVDIVVTDTDTGAFQRYRNPLSTPFEPITDTDAFDTCP